MNSGYSPEQLALMRVIQDNLPDSPTPFQELAALTGMEETEILEFLRKLKDAGVIRRFGATLRHHKSGWNHNAMVAWKADPQEADEWSHVAVENRYVSHAYYRPSPTPDWPYELYTMIHGKNPGDIEKVVADLRGKWPFSEYMVLETLKELKKISMTYFM